MAFRVRFTEAVRAGEPVQAGAQKGLLHNGEGDYYEFVEGGVVLKVHKASTNTTTYYGGGSWLLVETLDGQEPGPPPGVY